MAPGAPVFDDLGPPCICCCIASNVAFLNAHRIPGVEQTLVCHSLAEVIGNNGRLTNCYHIDLVYFEDLVHLFQRKNDASIKWNGSTCKPRTCTSRRNRYMLSIRKFHQLCDLLFVLSLDNNIGHMCILFSSFISSVRLCLLN